MRTHPLKPFVRGYFYVPTIYVDNPKALCESLTVEAYRQVDGMNDEISELDFTGEELENHEIVKVPCYDLSVPGYIGLPRAYGFKHYSHLNPINITRRPKPQPHLFKHSITPRNELQREFAEKLWAAIQGEDPCQVLANARTGSGKTTVSLLTAAKLGVPTLVGVHLNRLRKQWYGDFLKKHGIAYFFGEAWAKKYVGIAQQGKCDYKDKLIVITLLPSLARRNYGQDFYNHFGLFLIDEVHKTATPTLSACLGKIPARVVVGLTATNVKGPLAKVMDWYLGKPSVVSKQEVLIPKAHVHTFRGQVEGQINDHSDRTALTSLTELPRRNLFLRELILDGYHRGRNVVVISDRVKQLQTLMHMCAAEGVPQDALGLHVGEYYTGNYKVTVRTKASTGRDRWIGIGVASNRRKANQLIEQYIKDTGAQLTHDDVRIVEEKVKVTETQLDDIAKNCQIIFASYGIFDTGIDVPRLDYGVEASPRGDVRQAIGRLLREFPGKPDPEWHCVEDIFVYANVRASLFRPEEQFYLDFLIATSESRRRSFAFHKAEVIEHADNC